MPTLTVTAATDYTVAPFSTQVIGQSIDKITFATAGYSEAIFDAPQFGGNNIANTVLITGDSFTNEVTVNGTAATISFSAAGWTFANWGASSRVNFIDNDGNQTWTGSSQNDWFYDSAGNDTYIGGDGNDSFYFGLGYPGASDSINGGAGTGDLVRYDGTTQGVTVNLTLGFATGAEIGTDTLSNIEWIWSGSGADYLVGDANANYVIGGNGNDTIDGRGGADTIYGGNGNDFYYIDSTADFAFEDDATGGYDIVIASANFTLTQHVEQLVLHGAATHGVGNEQANYLYGGESGLSLNLNGAGGDDVLFSSLAGGNTLTGGNGIDTLLIYGGNNLANGGNGNDVYFTYTATDTISELGGSGIDTVYANWNFTMGLGIEQLLLFGSANTAVGSADDNIIYGNSTSGAVSLYGMDGADVLFGGTGNDYLDGGAGNDLFFGLGGQNTLVGGQDNDVFYIESAGNTVTELVGGGFDTMYSNVAGVTALAANVEQLILYGAATGGTGTSGNDYIYANSAAGAVTLDGGNGNDYLLGSAMNDVLTGGVGADQIDLQTGGNDFVRYAANGNLGADILYGFDAIAKGGGQDLIDVSGHSYSAASIGGAITLTSTSGGASTLVTFNSGDLAGTTITLSGVTMANMDATDFLF